MRLSYSLEIFRSNVESYETVLFGQEVGRRFFFNSGAVHNYFTLIFALLNVWVCAFQTVMF